MRWAVAAVLVVLPWISAAQAVPPQTFPYTAYITADDVYVRSGPGENYYPTDKLKSGQEVEVYRHDPGGWYAIRPPAGSFSWVGGRHLKLGAENLATVVDDRVPARVGTRFSDVRDVIQVRLHRGETVEVLDAKRTGPPTTTGANTWYKISPPSGEFRWVFGKWVDPQFARDGLRKNVPAAAGAGQEPTVRTPQAGTAHPPSASATPGAAGDGAQGSSQTTLGAEPSESELVNPNPPIPRRLSAEQYQNELNEIDVELSAMVVEEPTAWDFGELQQRTQSLLIQGETAVERGRARALLSKIARFEDIRQRHNAVAAMKQSLSRTDRQLARLGPRPQGARRSADPTDRFDAAGQLRRVQAAAGAPQYALVDEKGNLKCYISPAPGVNLQGYLGRQVGVAGTRGYMPEQRATHIMARNVSVLDAGTGATVLR